MPIRPGDLLGDYEILHLLGVGGMGEVYQVRNVLSDRIEAIKVLSAGLQGNLDLQERFLREIKISAGLRHPHIAELRTAQRVDGLLIMVMEFVDGFTVDALLRQGPLPPKNALHYTGQVLDALAYAHERGVVHRDIKPQNIMVTAGDEVRLMDFGIARSLADQGMTMTGMTLGSLYYMSPEQIRGEHADHRADLYSLGIALYEMVTGSKPFEGSSGYTVMAAHLDQPPPPPVERNPELPDALNDVILKAIQKSPDDRYQDAASFQQALLRLQSSLPGRVDPAIFRAAQAARDEQLAAGTTPEMRVNTPTQTMPVTPTPPGGRRTVPSHGAAPVSASQTPPTAKEKPERPAIRNWIAIGGMFIGLVAVVLTLGPRTWTTMFGGAETAQERSRSQRQQGSRDWQDRRMQPPDSPEPPRPGEGAAMVAGRPYGEGRSGPPMSDNELRSAMEEADAALKQAGIEIAFSGPGSREGRRFVALERADAMLAIAKRYGAAHAKREALGLRRREIPRLIQPMSQQERQAAMGAMGDHWRQVTEAMAAAEAAIKSQNLRLAGEELAIAEAAIDQVDKSLTAIEQRYGAAKPAAK